MLYFFTFAVDIKRHSQSDLKRSLDMLIHSLKTYTKTDFQMIVFTNFKIQGIYDSNIIFREYYNKCSHKLYSDKWLNLSFNKINIYKDLYEEFKENYIWIDLDTLVANDVSYLEKLQHFFNCHGGDNQTSWSIFKNNQEHHIPICKTILGNFWKLDIDLYNKLMNTLEVIKKRKLILKFDLQDLFNFQIYFVDKNTELYNILGFNFNDNIEYGLSIWSETNLHPNTKGLSMLYRDENHALRSLYKKNKEIHIISFTFNTLKKLWNLPHFRNVFNLKLSNF